MHCGACKKVRKILKISTHPSTKINKIKQQPENREAIKREIVATLGAYAKIDHLFNNLYNNSNS